MSYNSSKALFFVFLIMLVSSTAIAQDGAIFKNSAGDEVLFVGEDKNVGIGTTSPEMKLHVKANSSSADGISIENSGTGDPMLRFRDSEFAEVAKIYWDDSANQTIFKSQGALTYRILTNPASGEAIFSVQSSGGSERLRVEHDGFVKMENNLGVDGTGESYIAGDLRIDNSASIATNLGIGTTTPGRKLSVIGYVRAANASTETDYVEITHGGSNGFINTVGAGNLDFRHDNNTVMTLTDGGRLGLGTTSPDQKLHIWGSGEQKIIIESTDNDASLNLRSDGSGPYKIYSPSGTDDLRFYQGANHVTFTSDGKVGIGTTSPQRKLDVNGWVNIGGNIYIDDLAYFYCSSAGKYWRTASINGSHTNNDPGIVPEATGWGYIGVPDNRWYRAYINDIVSLSRYTYSDERLKENIRSIENPLEKIKNINGVVYDLREEAFPGEGNSRTNNDWQDRMGFVAQELEKVLPNVVELEDNKKEDALKVINYEALIPVLVEAMKEQQEQIEELKAKVEQLENR